VPALAARVAQAWRLWHGSSTHRTDVGRVLPALLRDARVAARQEDERRAANALLSDVYALVQHELVWAAEPELIRVVADRSVAAAHTADQPVSLAGAAWTLAIVQRSAGDLDGALELVNEAAGILEPRLEDGPTELRAMYGALRLHAATTSARDGREGNALRHLDEARATAERLPTGHHHPWTQFGTSNVALHGLRPRGPLQVLDTTSATNGIRRRRPRRPNDQPPSPHLLPGLGRDVRWDVVQTRAPCRHQSPRCSP
jgi:hypothetical protein